MRDDAPLLFAGNPFLTLPLLLKSTLNVLRSVPQPATTDRPTSTTADRDRLRTITALAKKKLTEPLWMENATPKLSREKEGFQGSKRRAASHLSLSRRAECGVYRAWPVLPPPPVLSSVVYEHD